MKRQKVDYISVWSQCVSVICVIVVLHGSCVSVKVAQRDSRCSRRWFDWKRQWWSKRAVFFSQGLSQSAAGWRLSPPIALWTLPLHVSSLRTDVFLVPACSRHWSGEGKRRLLSECVCTTLFFVTTQKLRPDGSVTFGYCAFRLSCCCHGDSCVVCLCPGRRWCCVTLTMHHWLHKPQNYVAEPLYVLFLLSFFQIWRIICGIFISHICTFYLCSLLDYWNTFPKRKKKRLGILALELYYL